MKREPKPIHGSPEWLRARQRDEEGRIRFGASEAPTLMGVNPFANLVDLFIEKHDSDPISIRSAAFHRGNVLEPALVTEAGREFGFDPFVPSVMFSEGRLVSNLDGADDPLDPIRIIEAKTTTHYEIGQPIPDSYYWQVVAQLATTEAEVVYVSCLDRRQQIGYWIVHRDESETAISALFDRADEIGELFDSSKLPDDVRPTQDQINRLYPNPEGTLDLDDQQLDEVRSWITLKAELKALEEREAEKRNLVASFIGKHEIATYNGKTIATYKSQRLGARFDSTRFRNDHPDLYNQYLNDGATTRVLRLSKGASE